MLSEQYGQRASAAREIISLDVDLSKHAQIQYRRFGVIEYTKSRYGALVLLKATQN